VLQKSASSATLQVFNASLTVADKAESKISAASKEPTDLEQ
jgi:hypothetical protein